MCGPLLYDTSMKIEKLSENSIKCTLTNFDLSVRDLNVNELAYGTEKAKRLFSEMMTRASNELGFDAQGGPLMIEAVPMNDAVELTITRVDDPEELDARFSRFSPGPAGQNTDSAAGWIQKITSDILEGAAGFLSQLHAKQGNESPITGAVRISLGQPVNAPAQGQPGTAKNAPGQGKGPGVPEITWKAVSFDTLDLAIRAAKSVSFFDGESILYKKNDGSCYIIMVKCDGDRMEDFAKAVNGLTEFGQSVVTTMDTKAYYDEHYKVIVKSPAIPELGKIK